MPQTGQNLARSAAQNGEGSGSATYSLAVEITDHQIDQHWADGATVLPKMIDPQWRERLATAIERDIAGDRLDSEQCPLVYDAT